MIILGPMIGVLLAGLLVNPAPPPSRIVATGLDNPRGLAFGVYKRQGQVHRIVTGLPSQATPTGAEAVGPSDVTLDQGGTPRYTTGPGSLLAVGRGRIVVSAGGGELLRVGTRGRTSTIASFPDHGATSVANGPDGAFYVGGKTGVRRVTPRGRSEVYAAGPAVTDLAWGPDGRLYLLERDALIRIGPRGTRQVVANGLTAPGGLTIRGGAAYVTDCGDCRGTGSILKIKIR